MEQVHEVDTGERVAQLWREHVWAARRLLKHRAFTFVVALTLGLAIGGNTAIYSVVSGVLLEPLPYPHPEQLVRVYSQRPQFAELPLTPADFHQFREDSPIFANVAAFFREGHEFNGSAGPENLEGLFVSAGYFELLGARVALGRTFSSDDERPGNADRVIVSDRIWRTRFGADPSIIGRAINLSRRPFEVVGVMAAGIEHVGGRSRSLPHGETADFWIPLTFNTANLSRTSRFLNTVGRLATGVSVRQANAELDRLSQLQAQRFPDTHTGWQTTVTPLVDEIVGSARPVLLAILGAVACVLLVACGNVACLTLGRSIARTREHAMRAALGASRWRLAREILIESWLLALLGALLGIPLAIVGVQALVGLAPPHLPRLHAIGVDAGMVAVGLGITLLTSILCGLLPAWYGSRTNLDAALRESGRSGGPGARSLGWHRILVVAQLSLCFALVVSAGLLARTFFLLQQQSFGFRPEGVLTMIYDLPGGVTRYGKDVNERALFHERLLTLLRTQPGVVSVGTSVRLPFAAQLDATDSQSLGRYEIADKPVAPEERPFARMELVSSGYLDTIGVPLVEGRGFDARDTLTSDRVVLVSRELVRRSFPGENVVGRTLRTGRNAATIVGVVGDMKATATALTTEPTIYLPMAQSPINRTRLAVRANGDPQALLPIVRRAVTSIDPELPVFDVKPLTQIAGEAVATQRFALLLFALFAGLTLVLSVVGIYGVLAYSVAHRLPEFGVRLALGARPKELVAMVLVQGAWLVGVGIALGAGVSVVATRGIRGLLFGVRPFDPLTLAVVALIFCVVAAAACFGPARRAGRIDPLTALRTD
jgi:predicted permease